MDFSNLNIPEILFSAFPSRFQEFSPQDFEDFIAQMFRDQGHEVEQTKYSGDFGADLIIQDIPDRTVVQVKRYAKNTKVGVKDINQLIGARDYYEAQNSIIVTTSSFTPQALVLCKKTRVIVWDWEMLSTSLCNTYFGGVDYYTFFEERLSQDTEYNRHLTAGHTLLGETIDDLLDFRIVQLITGQQSAGRNSRDISILLFTIQNLSSENLACNVLDTDFITTDHRQVKMSAFWSEYFSSGTIYARASVTCGVFYPADQLPCLDVGSKLIISFSLDNHHVLQKYISIESLDGIKLPTPPPEPSASWFPCYVATYLYGRGTEPYDQLVFFREYWLRRSSFGRLLIRIYYKAGPRLVTLSTQSTAARKFISFVAEIVLSIVRPINSMVRR